VLRAALGQAGPVGIFGTDYPTADGTAVRDYIHVADLADAHVKALDYLAAAERLGGRPVPRHETARRPGDPPALVADPGRARAALGWQATRSDLDTIIGTALAWHRAHPPAGTAEPL